MKMNPKKPLCLLDMDEVLANFIKSALGIHGVEDDPREIGSWDLSAALGISADEFWNPIQERGERFWTSIEPLSWLEELLDLVRSLFGDNWIVATSPSRCPMSYSGKAKWFSRYVSKDLRHFSPNSQKHLLAAPNRVLIDDREENCIHFAESGGATVLFPTRGGPLYPFAENPMETVESMLRDVLLHPAFEEL